jgi:hypothetical protein
MKAESNLALLFCFEYCWLEILVTVDGEHIEVLHIFLIEI